MRVDVLVASTTTYDQLQEPIVKASQRGLQCIPASCHLYLYIVQDMGPYLVIYLNRTNIFECGVWLG
jgi:hypothetical protein